MCRMKGTDPSVIHLAGPFQPPCLPGRAEQARQRPLDALVPCSIRFSLSVEKFLMSTDLVQPLLSAGVFSAKYLPVLLFFSFVNRFESLGVLIF